MATKKTKKTATLQASLQIDGKAQDHGSQMPGTLDQIMNESMATYSARSSEEYISQLAEMNQTDLQSHAYKVGLIPIEDRKVLVERLTQEFRAWASRQAPVNTQNTTVNSSNISDEVRKILREGA
jgi:hypothetical protein